MQAPCLYQTIHVFDGECLLLEEHLKVLTYWSREIFGLYPRLNSIDLRNSIIRNAEENAPQSDRSKFVRLVLTAAGETQVLFEGLSLYRGYDLRSLMPEAITLEYEPPLFDAPTSAREAAVALACQYVRHKGASVAVRCNPQGVVCAANSAPLYAVRGVDVFVSPGAEQAERELGRRSIAAAGLSLNERPVLRNELSTMDELFYVDHRGVTALAHCDGVPYMAILSERVARGMRSLFPKM